MDEPKPINEFEPIDKKEDFENEVQQAFLRRPAPPGLKRRIMNQRASRRTEQSRSRVVLWQRVAAGLVLAATIGGALTWRHVEEQRKGEAARDQVLTALRITSHALNQIQAQLAARDHNE
ncbi:MAG: hypothetical protein ACLPH3_22460 [Terracidiphilus sp.]